MLSHAPFWLCVSLVVFFLGYRFYSRFLAVHVFESEGDDSPTPAVTMQDDVDYVPTNRHVVLGHHFTSIAGAAPIVGPAVACSYGWMPAVLWIVFGVVFIGAMHDFAALVMSVRHAGKSVGDIAGELIGNRPRVLFLCLIVVLTWLVLAVFASVIATLFHKNAASVLPVNIEIPIALVVGWWVHKRKGGLLWPSIAALVVMWGSVWFTARNPALQFTMPEVAGFSPVQVWTFLLLAYSFVTCLLPVWLLLQPRDFVNSHQLFVGLGALYLAIFIGNPVLTAPAVDLDPAFPGPIFPLLFVTIACGAVSGFHSLVASGTTSKQISSLRHARAVGYGSMLGEGCLALAATMAVAAGFSEAGWHDHYRSDTRVNPIVAFVQGAGNLLEGGMGVPGDVATTIIAVIVISFAATTLDSACRIQRYCLGELGRAWRLPVLNNRVVAAAIAAFTPLFLVVQTTNPADPSTSVPLWKLVWPVFGSANQMLGALALLVATVWLRKRGKPLWFTGVPAVLLAVITLSGLVHLIRTQLAAESTSLAVVVPAAVLLLLALAILFEGGLVLVRGRREAA